MSALASAMLSAGAGALVSTPHSLPGGFTIAGSEPGAFSSGSSSLARKTLCMPPSLPVFTGAVGCSVPALAMRELTACWRAASACCSPSGWVYCGHGADASKRALGSTGVALNT